MIAKPRAVPAVGPGPAAGRPITVVQQKGSRANARGVGAPNDRPGRARRRRGANATPWTRGRTNGRSAPRARTQRSGYGGPRCHGPSRRPASGRGPPARGGPPLPGPRTGPRAGIQSVALGATSCARCRDNAGRGAAVGRVVSRVSRCGVDRQSRSTTLSSAPAPPFSWKCASSSRSHSSSADVWPCHLTK